MSNCLPFGAIHVDGLRLWAHVGVLDNERLLGQYFEVNFSIWTNLENVCDTDKIEQTYDYSIAIKEIQKLSFSIDCFTVEYFSRKILDCLEEIYGKVPMKVFLLKCSPPVPGFCGRVAVENYRNFK